MLTASALIEIIASALMAPLLMVIQSGAVIQIVLGRDTGWNPQRRDDGSIPFRDIVRRHRLQTALGFLTGISAFLLAPSLAGWMSPTIIGLILAIPISAASGMLSIGLALKRAGLLVTPEEAAPPPIATRANALMREFSQLGFDDDNGLRAIHHDEALRHFHLTELPPGEPRKRGAVQPERAIAEARIRDAESVDDVVSFIQPKEAMALLGDRGLIAMFARLPQHSTAV